MTTYNRYNKSSNTRMSSRELEDVNHMNKELLEESVESKDKPQFDLDVVKVLSLRDLQTYIKRFDGFSTHNIGNKELLICELMKHINNQYSIKITGVLEIIQDNYGFLRYMENNYLHSKYDIYVSPQYIQKYGLRRGDTITCTVVSKVQQIDKFFAVGEVLKVSGFEAKHSKGRDLFEYLTPQYPEEQIILETENDESVANQAMRAIDLIAPIGKGQRMLIVSQPKSGKTTLLQQMALRIASIAEEQNLFLIVLLIDERPEEVTDMKRLLPNSMVISSTFDQDPDKHIKVVEIVFDMIKRMAEAGRHVVILLDSLTRVARAYNNQAPGTGKSMTGGLDAGAIQKAKACLGAARNLKEGGSVTIIATALNNTGSKGDDVVYEELKSTGNSELELSRKIAQKNVFPAIEIGPSSTRKADLFIPQDYYRKLKILWNFMLNSMTPEDAIVWLLDMIKNTKTNKMLFEYMSKNSSRQK